MQHRGTFDKLLISFNPLTVTPDGYSESGAVATDSGHTGRLPSALRCSFHASDSANAANRGLGLLFDDLTGALDDGRVVTVRAHERFHISLEARR
jgi:hypothetical protein